MEYSQNYSKLENQQLPFQIQNQSLVSLVEKMETESEGNDEIETNNLNSSAALTILNKSSLNNSLELDNEVFYEVCENDEKGIDINIQEATLNFLRTLNHPIIFKAKDLNYQEKNSGRGFRKVKIRINKLKNDSLDFEQKMEKRKPNDWEGMEDIFLHKLKKLKV